MGLIRFLVPERQWLADDVLQRIHMSGLDEIPWPSRAHWDGTMLVLEPSVTESGNVEASLKPLSKPRTAVMNVRAITLRRMEN